MPIRKLLLLGCALALLVPMTGSAQSEDADQKASAKRQAEAERLKRVGMGLARRGKYDEAFATFESVLPLIDYPDDQVLYNLGAIAFEALKDCRRALLYFHGYLYAAPADPSSGQVRQRRNQCMARVKDTGTLIVKGDPSGAEVRVNNVILGRTPLKAIVVPAGSYQIDANMMEHDPYSGSVTVDAGLETRHKVSLAKKIYRGNLKVVSDPPGATVFINEVNVGTAPVEQKNLPTKKYLVRVEKEGMDRWIRYVTVDRGQTVEVEVKMEATGVNVAIPPLP